MADAQITTKKVVDSIVLTLSVDEAVALRALLGHVRVCSNERPLANIFDALHGKVPSVSLLDCALIVLYDNAKDIIEEGIKRWKPAI